MKTAKLQKLAKIMDIDVTSHIESILMKIYKDGDIGTLESTLELKEQIFAKEKKLPLQRSKAAKSILFRQHFLELGRIADENVPRGNHRKLEVHPKRKQHVCNRRAKRC